MKKPNCSRDDSGFTLVELLVVIAIVSILSTAVLLTLNPAQLRRRAREQVVRGNVTKICAALHSCAAVHSNATRCDSYEEIGATEPTDDPDALYIFPSPDIEGDPQATVHVNGSLGTGTEVCEFSCSFNFGTDGGATNVRQLGNCI